MAAKIQNNYELRITNYELRNTNYEIITKELLWRIALSLFYQFALLSEQSKVTIELTFVVQLIVDFDDVPVVY